MRRRLAKHSGCGPEARLDQLALQVLEDHWRLFRKAFRRCRDDCSEKTVHDLRVAIRRFVATWDMVRCLLGELAADDLDRKLKKYLKLLSPLRDTHVRLSYLQAMQARYPQLRQVCEATTRDEQKLLRRIARKINGLDLQPLNRLVARRRKALRKRLPAPAARCEGLRRLASALRQAFQTVDRRWRQFDAQVPKTIHRGRVAFKQFRYLVEATQPILGRVYRPHVRVMRSFQIRMGVIQDLEVISQWLAAYADHQKRRHAQALGPVLKELELRHRRRIAAFLRTAAQVYQFAKPLGCQPSRRHGPS